MLPAVDNSTTSMAFPTSQPPQNASEAANGMKAAVKAASKATSINILGALTKPITKSVVQVIKNSEHDLLLLYLAF